jgi:hypothetical protein
MRWQPFRICFETLSSPEPKNISILAPARAVAVGTDSGKRVLTWFAAGPFLTVLIFEPIKREGGLRVNFSALSSWSLAGVCFFETFERGAQDIGLCRGGPDGGHSEECSPRQANNHYSSGDE